MFQVVETVLEFARKNEIELIGAVTNFTVAPLSKNRNPFQGVSPLALGPHAAFEVTADKFRTICRAPFRSPKLNYKHDPLTSFIGRERGLGPTSFVEQCISRTGSDCGGDVFVVELW